MYFSLGIVLSEIIFQDELRCCPSTTTNWIDYLLIWDKYAQLQLAVVNFSVNEHCITFASQEIITNMAARKKVLTKFSFNILVPRSSEVYLEPSQTYKMAFFAKIVNDFQPFIFANSSILDVCLGSDCVPGLTQQKIKIHFFWSPRNASNKIFWRHCQKKKKLYKMTKA